jgi:hypothetical protein
VAAVRFAVFLLRSPDERRSHAAAAVHPPTVDLQRAAELHAQGWTLRSRCGTGGSRRDGSYCRGVRHRRCPSRSRYARRARCATALPVLRNPVCSTWCPLSVATGNVRVYLTAFSASHRVVVTLKQWPLPCEARHTGFDPDVRSAETSMNRPVAIADLRRNSYSDLARPWHSVRSLSGKCWETPTPKWPAGCPG